MFPPICLSTSVWSLFERDHELTKYVFWGYLDSFDDEFGVTKYRPQAANDCSTTSWGKNVISFAFFIVYLPDVSLYSNVAQEPYTPPGRVTMFNLEE